MESPISYGRKICDSIMNTYSAEELPPKGALFYHQGVFLSGMLNVYNLTGEEKYFDYIKKYIDSTITPNGGIYGIDRENSVALDSKFEQGLVDFSLNYLDCKQPVILMYELYDKTGDEKYLKAIKTISESMYFWPVNMYGGYWHMLTTPNQMWLDSTYMAGVLSVMYSARFGDERLMNRAIEQIFIFDKYLKNEKTGMYYHAFDPTYEAEWADKETGCSKEAWGRAVGWYAVAILDMLDYIPESHSAVEKLKKIERELLASLAKYTEKKTGMWCEVLDKPEYDDNWVETSCTCLIVYSYAKAIRKGIVSGSEYAKVCERAYESVIDSLYYDDNGNLILDNICCGTCVEEGTYEWYVNRPRCKNDLHGSGAFALMCAEMERYFREK